MPAAIEVIGGGAGITNGTEIALHILDTDFGQVATVNGIKTATFTIQSVGSTSLSLNGTHPVQILDSEVFRITEQPTATIAAGATDTFEITFNPDVVLDYVAHVTISNDSPSNPFTFRIEGSGFVCRHDKRRLLTPWIASITAETSTNKGNWADYNCVHAAWRDMQKMVKLGMMCSNELPPEPSVSDYTNLVAERSDRC